ncbi:MAG: tetratricopeptide repeat protein, partial [Planctomycetota bacterium]
PHLELAVSDAYDQLAKLQSERGNKTLAEDIYRQSVQRWQSIHEGVGSQNTLDKLVIAHTNLGLTLNQLARQPEAIESYNKAINLLSNLEEANRRVESSRLLADALDKRAIAMMQQGDLDSAIESYQHSAEVYKLVISRKPDHPEILSDYSNMCSNLGIAFAMSNRTMKARERFKEAKEICERLVELYPDESEYRYELAGYLANLARSLNELGEPEQSEKFSLESIGHLRQVSAKDGRLGYRSRLIVALSNFANFLRDNNRMKEALSFYEEAIPQSRQLIEDQPDVPGNKRDLARLYNNLGRLHESQNRISEALGTYRDSRDLRQELVDAYPDSVDFRHGLGLSENGLGTAYVKSGDHLKAEACFERANAIFERLVNENPNVGMYQESKGWALAKMGFLHLSKGQYPEAKDWMIKTVASRRALVEADREIVEYRNLLGGALNDLGIAQRELGEFEQASRSFQEAIEHQKYALGKNPNRIRYREYLGEHHIELALTNAATLEFDRIAQDVDSFLELWPGSGRRIFDFATRLAAKADAEVMQEKGIPQATEFVEQVKRLTRSASNLEDFDVPNLSSLPQFDAVLSMPEFRKFASELETDG